METRQVVLSTALELVTEGGLDALTISRLTTRSGVSNGSVYHHFGSRGGVLGELYRDSYERCVASLVPALDGRPAADVVPELVSRYLDWIVANQARARFIYAASAEGEVPDGKTVILGPVAAWFVQRMERGEVRALPVWALDPVVMGPAHECARRFLAAPGQFDLGTARRLAAEAAWAVARA
jgi:AcrR family transcriptional regulator